MRLDALKEQWPSDNTFFPDQVKAMEQRAKQVGKGGELYYINPANGDYFTKNLTEGARAEALGMADHLLEDFHVTVKTIMLLSRFVAFRLANLESITIAYCRAA
eukprot:COSAG04_NODE_26_length_37184_cov_14.641149_30_plen_104_part_00